jgi:hypothetical protein
MSMRLLGVLSGDKAGAGSQSHSQGAAVSSKAQRKPTLPRAASLGA